MRNVLIFFGFLLLLSACTSEVVVEESIIQTQVVEPIVTDVVKSAVSTPQPTPLTIESSTPTNIPTAAPSSTKTSTPEPPTTSTLPATNVPTQPAPTATLTTVPVPTIADNGIANLDGFAWENRHIVVFAESSEVVDIVEQFWAEDDAVIDRRILWFVVADNTVATNYTGNLSSALADTLRVRYARLDTLPEVVLIGLDTGVKNRQPFLDASAIYGQIDQMPMRQNELSQRGE